jgi:hypothetical protein
LTYWPPRDRQPRALATWFSPSRWSANDFIIALAALVLAVSVFVPWFQATVKTRDPEVSGVLIQPPGTATGIGVHGFLWAAFGLALLQFAVLAARYFPGRPVRLPAHRQFLLVTSALSFIAIGVGVVIKPSAWFGTIDLGPGLSLVIGWTYGAVVALGAALISLGMAVAAVRDHSGPGAHR